MLHKYYHGIIYGDGWVILILAIVSSIERSCLQHKEDTEALGFQDGKGQSI